MSYPDRCGICHNCGAPLETATCAYCGTWDARMAGLVIASPEHRIDLAMFMVRHKAITEDLAKRLLAFSETP